MQTTPSLVRRLFDQAFNQGDLTILDELVAADSLTHIMSWGMPAGRLGLKHLIASLRIAFPDLRTTLEAEIHEGAGFAACWMMSGTHTGSYLGNPPTGRKILAKGILFAATENGQIVEDWMLVDQLGMLQQLGIVPPPGN